MILLARGWKVWTYCWKQGAQMFRAESQHGGGPALRTTIGVNRSVRSMARDQHRRCGVEDRTPEATRGRMPDGQLRLVAAVDGADHLLRRSTAENRAFPQDASFMPSLDELGILRMALRQSRCALALSKR